MTDQNHNRRLMRHLPAWLRHRGLTQAALAIALNKSDATISSYFSGRQAMTVGVLAEIAAILRCDPSELLFAPSDQAKARAMRELAEIANSLSDAELDAFVKVGAAMRKN